MRTTAEKKRGRRSRNVFRDGNVFRGVRLPAETEHLAIRADLLIQLQNAIAGRGLTEGEAAKLLGVTQPRISDLLRGRFDLFSSDALIDMLARLGIRLRLVRQASARVKMDRRRPG